MPALCCAVPRPHPVPRLYSALRLYPALLPLALLALLLLAAPPAQAQHAAAPDSTVRDTTAAPGPWTLLARSAAPAARAAAAPSAAAPSAGAPSAEASEVEARAETGEGARRAAVALDFRLHYAVEALVRVRMQPTDTAQVYVELGFRDPVHVLRRVDARWCHVQTDDGARGYAACRALSNVWLRVSKRQRRLFVYRGPKRVRSIPADFGYNWFADKERQGNGGLYRDHWRTPEGTFYVVKKNPDSRYHRALVLNYPQPADARRGLEQGLISQAEHDAIVRAAREHAMPPMHTALGGWIEIHGGGTGAATNWTEGCIALPNDALDALWHLVRPGTPVIVE